jgi:DNA-binding transcriptional LysR family regulator
LAELRRLKYFIAVAEEENLRRAAQRLNMAAPPLSVQIRQLEVELGVPLFTREGRGIQLTEAGRAFLGEAKQVLAQVQRSMDVARRTSRGELGILTIAYNAPSEFLIFPRVVPAFRRAYPEVQLNFAGMQAPRQLDALRAREVDIGLLWLPAPTEDFEVTELLDEELNVAVPADHPLAAREIIRISDLSGEPLVLASRRYALETFSQIELAFRRAGAKMNVAYELDHSVSMINFVAMGLGCAIVPDYTRAIHQIGVVHRRLEPCGFTKTLGAIKRRGEGGAIATFYDFLIGCFPRSQTAAAT